MRSHIATVFITIAVLCAQSSLGFADNPQLRDRDFEAVQEYVNSKRTLVFFDKEPCLTLLGNVTFNSISRTEKQDGRDLRGIIKPDGTHVPHNDFDIELNLKAKYKTERTWAQARLQFHNPFGIELSHKTCKEDPQGLQGGGTCDDIALREAFFGFHVLHDCPEEHYFDIILGRKRIYQEFESRIEFNSRLDGIVFHAGKKFQPHWEAYCKTALFVVDERANHYAYVAEIGTYDFFETKFDLKYSFIDWKKRGLNRCNARDPIGTRFKNSHWLVRFNINPEYLLWEKRGKLYAGFMYNHAAKKIRDLRRPNGDPFFPNVSGNTKQNRGWYAGFVMGDENMNEPGDWAFDCNYQYVEAQAVSDFDARGIGRGNVNRETFTANGRGKTNYKGFLVELVWAVTNCVSMDLLFESTHEIDKRLGGSHSFSQLGLDVVYQF